MLPGLARAERDERVAVRPVAGADLGRTIYAYARRSSTSRPAIREAVAALRETGAAESA
jgi:DNA-binding transcriptional LysR family regulator